MERMERHLIADQSLVTGAATVMRAHVILTRRSERPIV